MSYFKLICDLDYNILACFVEHMQYLDLNNNAVRKHLDTLKKLHTSVGYLKSEYLEMHRQYWKAMRFRIEYYTKLFLKVKIAIAHSK